MDVEPSAFLSSTTLLIGTVVGLVVLYFFHSWNNHYWKSKPIPSERPLPLIGNLLGLFFGKSFRDVDDALYKKHGKLFGAYELGSPNIFVAEPELLKLILVKDFHAFTDRRSFKSGNKIIDASFACLGGEAWKRVRNIVSPSFSTGKIKAMCPNIQLCASKTTQNILKMAEKGPVEIKNVFNQMTLDIIASVAFGTELDSYNDVNNPFVVQAKKAFNTDMNIKTVFATFWPSLASKFGIRLAFANLDVTNFFKDLVVSIIERRKKTKEKRNDFLQLMMEKLPEENTNGTAKGDISKTLSYDEMIGQSVIFFLAGFDTTASAMSLVIYNLALHPEARKNVLKEVDRIFETSNPIDGALTEAHYLDAVISETFRYTPSGARIERKATEDYTLGDTGIVIPKGMMVIIPFFSIMQDPELFPEPDKFIPERFLPDPPYKIQPFSFLPFGDGPRNCIAKRFALVEVKLCLLMILRQIEFFPCQETKIPFEYYTGSVALQPKSITLKAVKRNTSVS